MIIFNQNDSKETTKREPWNFVFELKPPVYEETPFIFFFVEGGGGGLHFIKLT